MPRQPLPPLNTLGYVLADATTALPLLEGGRVLVFSSDAAAKAFRGTHRVAAVRAARVLAVAMVPLMLAGEVTLAEGRHDVALLAALEGAQVVGLEEVAEGRKRQRRRLAP